MWMKEVFANFMAAKIVNPVISGAESRAAVSETAHYPAGLRRGPHRRAPNSDPPAAREPEGGRRALRRDHLPEGADCHASARVIGGRCVPRWTARVPPTVPVRQRAWPDLIALLDRRTPHDLATWSRAWVEEPGRPIITTELSPEGRIENLAFTVLRDPFRRVAASYLDREHAGSAWIRLRDRDTDRALGRLSGSRTEVSAAHLGLPAAYFPSCPHTAVASRTGNFILDSRSLAWLSGPHLPEIHDALTRGSCVG